MKIDTDGFETQILDGALETLRKYRPVIVIESHESMESGQSSVRIEMALNGLDYLHLATLDASNEVYVHRTDSRLSAYKRYVRRSFIIKKTFLGTLNLTTTKVPNGVPAKKLKFTSNTNSRFFFQNFFLTDGIPWNYIATSSVIHGGARFLRISGLVLGTDCNLICVSDNVPTIFSLLLPSGLYSNILIPLKNLRDATNIRVVVRGSGLKGVTLILRLRIDVLS